jgi:hypothetical protein
MLLREAVFAIERAGNRFVVCAKEPFRGDSEARLVELTEAFAVPRSVLNEGFAYFLGPEDVAELRKIGSDASLTPERVVDLMCHYAVFDAYPEWATAPGGGSHDVTRV